MKKKIKFRRFNRELFLVATYAGCLSAFFTAWDGLSDGFGTELTQFVIYGAVLMIVGVVAWAAINTVSEEEESDTQYNLSCIKSYVVVVAICLAFAYYLFG